MSEAIILVWKAMGWHPRDEGFTTRKQQEKSVVPVPEIRMEWDEASCGQLVWLYNETTPYCDGHTEQFFNALAHPDRLPKSGEIKGRALRVASIDIGGGTTNMAVVHYQLDDGTGANVKITPHLLLREGFKVAGDDMLLDVIQCCVLSALQIRLQQAGVTDTVVLLAMLLGDFGRIDIQVILRQQTAL